MVVSVTTVSARTLCNGNDPKQDGILSKASWGETAGIYPTNSESDIYKLDKWDKDKTCELLKARAAINNVATKNKDVRKGSPNKRIDLEMKLKPYHLIENFPPVDDVINNKDVQWLYLSIRATAPPNHPGAPYTTELVKSYGPFYNDGGGDAPKGMIYILFYKKDTTNPTISISPTNNPTTATVTIKGTASDNVKLSKVEVKVGSGLSWQTATGTTSWSRSVTLASGPNTIYARATDASGNTKETSITVTYSKK